MKQIELKYIVKDSIELYTFLTSSITNKSKNNIKSFLKNGNVYVNDKIITKYNHLLNKNDKVLIKLSQIGKINDKNKMEILYEDDYLIIVNKTSGLLTVSTPKENAKTLYRYVSSYVKRLNNNNKIYIVNRLDKDTSGIVVFAKNENVKGILQNNWDKYVKLREYIAIVHGISDSGTVKSYLNENSEHFVYSTDNTNGKLAITDYKMINTNKKYSMLKIILHTGRKNQIRVHMKDINHPILGDKKYGIKDNFKRLMLHSSRLDFIHPVNKKLLKIECSIPNDFYNTIKSI